MFETPKQNIFSFTLLFVAKMERRTLSENYVTGNWLIVYSSFKICLNMVMITEVFIRLFFCFVLLMSLFGLSDHPMLLLVLDLNMFFVFKFKNNLALELNFISSLLLACKNKYTNKNTTCLFPRKYSRSKVSACRCLILCLLIYAWLFFLLFCSCCMILTLFRSRWSVKCSRKL